MKKHSFFPLPVLYCRCPAGQKKKEKRSVRIMKDVFLFSLRAVLPILLLIALGYAVRRTGKWSDAFFNQLNGFCFRIFLPVQLFLNVYEMESLAEVNWRLLSYLLGGIVLALGFGALAARLFVPDPRQKGVITMTAFRTNQVILGLPLAEALGGSAAMGFASLGTSFCVPVFNILSVLTLTAYADGGKKRSFGNLVGQTLRNPLIIGAGLGFIAIFLRQFIPVADGVPVFTLQAQLPSVYKVLKDLAKVASPLMIFVLGARLDFGETAGLLPKLALGISLRLVIMPALLIGGALCFRDALGLTATELPTLLAVFASPCAVSSTVMVQEIGGDEQLAGQMVMWSTVLSMLSIFCFTFVLESGGLL